MDNFFTSEHLFSRLQKLGIGAVGTTRTARKDFPLELKRLVKDVPPIMKLGDQYPWNTMRSQGVRHEREQEDVHAFIWLDNAVVCGITTVHDVNYDWDSYTICNRKRPGSGYSVVRRVFGEHSGMLLPIPNIINDYNNLMNSVDRSDHLRAGMTTHLPGLRVWLPLFFWLLDCAKVNSYVLYTLHYNEAVLAGIQPTPKRLTHREFHHELAFSMILEGYRKMKGHECPIISPDNEMAIIGTKPQKENTFKLRESKIALPIIRFNGSYTHEIVQGIRRFCIWCRHRANLINRPVFGEIINGSIIIKRSRTAQTRSSCSACKVPLCKTPCFADFHCHQHGVPPAS